jgi:hypothetical protein
MSQKNKTTKVGRPLANIDIDKLRELARFGCSQDEIASFFGVDQSTISRRFASEYERARAECKIHIRRAQMKLVGEGNPAMLIHLGKHYLGQTDRAEITGKNGGPIDISDAKAALLRGLVPDAAGE